MFTIHQAKGKNIAQTITDRTDYAENPDKTRKGELVTGYCCNPRTVDTEFLLSKSEYASNTGRSQGKHDILAYHIRQSFKPGEIDEKTANRIGYELALKFTGGRHAFIVATHIDKAHIHNHVIFNSTALDCMGKFKDPKRSGKIIRRISDQLCVENGLSVIENPKPSRGHYGTWLGDKKVPNARKKLEVLIDKILEMKPSDFEHFIKLLEAEGCEYKRDRRSVRLPGQKGFIRLKSLSHNYKEDTIRERIFGKLIVEPKKIIIVASQKLSLLIDVQNSIKAQNSPGYEQWAKIFSLKQAAKTLIFLQDNNLTELDKLNETAQKAKDDFNEIQSGIHAADARLKGISTLQKHIGAYGKTKEIYAEYKKQKYSKKFFAENEAAINACKAAKTHFNELKLDKLPTIKMLQTEYAAVSAEKKKLYSGYNAARSFMQEILTARQNVQMLLNYRDTENSKETKRDER